MLHLEPGVDLEEVELPGVDVEHEFDRARGAVGLGFEQGTGRVGERGTRRRREARCGRLLEHLLAPALRRAVAVAEGHDRASPVAEDLHLHVARVGDQPLQEHRRVAERLPALLHRLRHRGRQRARVGAGQHADAASTGDALHEQREAERPGGGHRGVDVGERSRPGRQRHAGGGGRGARLVLGPEPPDLCGRRADEAEPRVLDRGGGVGVLGEEPVPGMDAVGLVLGSHRQELLDAAVAGAGRGADGHRDGGEVTVGRRRGRRR